MAVAHQLFVSVRLKAAPPGQRTLTEQICKRFANARYELPQAFRFDVDFIGKVWSERRDLNSRPPVPQTGALTGLRYAPPIGWKPFIYAGAVGRARAGRETTISPQSAPRIRK
jgi:hypothetical protein